MNSRELVVGSLNHKQTSVLPVDFVGSTAVAGSACRYDCSIKRLLRT